MRDCTQGRFRQQLSFLRRQFLQEGELPFSNVLSEEIVKQALSEADVVWNERIYTPLVSLGFRRYSGKGQSELSLLRQLWDSFSPGDVLLADRLMCSWREMTILKQRGVDTVTRLCRHID